MNRIHRIVSKSILLYAVLLFCHVAVAQQLMPIAGYFKPGETPKFGETLSDTIYNAGSYPAHFYAAGNHLLPNTDQSFLHRYSNFTNWLTTGTEKLTADQRRLTYATRLATLQKNIFGSNTTGLNAPPATELQTALLNPIVAFHSFNSVDAATFFVNTLCALAAIDTACNCDNFKIAQLKHYTVAEFRMGNKWVAIDPAPDAPALLFANGKGGYYAAAELVADTALVRKGIKNQNYRHVNARGETLFTWLQRPELYPLKFIGGTYTPVAITPTALTKTDAEIILPPGAALVFSIKNDGLNIDTSTAAGRNLFNEAFAIYTQYNNNEDDKLIEKIITLLANYEGITREQAMQAAAVEKVSVQGSKSGFTFTGKYTAFPYHPVAEIVIPPHTDTIVIGRDLKAPFVLNVEGESLWQPAGNERVQPQTTVQLLNNGVLPPNTEPKHFRVYINPRMYNWLGGWSIVKMKDADKLTHSRKK